MVYRDYLPKHPIRQANLSKNIRLAYVHVDITELRCETGKWYLFVAIDRLTKYVYVELHPRMTQEVAVQFLRNLQDACVFKITHILTDNGAQFTYNLLASHLQPNKKHAFTALCEQLGIEHRTTQFRHPWTNGQVEITNKIIKQATTKQFHYETPDDLKVHLQTFILYYNHQRPLKSLKLKTPWQLVQECYNQNPEFFKSNPLDKIVGLKTYTIKNDFSYDAHTLTTFYPKSHVHSSDQPFITCHAAI